MSRGWGNECVHSSHSTNNFTVYDIFHNVLSFIGPLVRKVFDLTMTQVFFLNFLAFRTQREKRNLISKT